MRRIFIHLMNGLREVHANKLLHLDIKPANVYIAMDGRPVLLDFGAARITLSDEPMKLKPMYTAGFAAPEQYKFEPGSLGPWSDIYSVGATLYTCIAGTPPQAADARIEKDRLIPLRTLARQPYSDELYSIVEACLKHRPPGAPADRLRAAEAPHDRAGGRRQEGLLRHPQQAPLEVLHQVDRARRPCASPSSRTAARATATATRTGSATPTAGRAADGRRRRDGRAHAGRGGRRDRGDGDHAPLPAGGAEPAAAPLGLPRLGDQLRAPRHRLARGGAEPAGVAPHHLRGVHRAGRRRPGGRTPGDSRLYVLRGGKLAAATQDHSRVQQMVDSGIITRGGGGRAPRAQQDLQLPGRRRAPGDRRRQRVPPARRATRSCSRPTASGARSPRPSSPTSCASRTSWGCCRACSPRRTSARAARATTSRSWR